MQENYPGIKDANPDFASKDIIAVLAKQWAEVSPAEKQEWKARAIATHGDEEEEDGDAAAEAAAAAVMDDVGVEDEEEEDEEEDDDGPAPPARKSKRGKK